MIQLIFWSILSYGLMNIMVFGKIFEEFRSNIKMTSEMKIPVVSPLFQFIHGIITCPMCFSTWAGFVLSIVLWSPAHQLMNTSESFSWFFDGLYSSGIVWTINSIIEWFERE